MDNFTFGMFGEMDDYNAREEAREELERQDEGTTERQDEGTTER